MAAFSAERIAEGGSYLQGRVGSRMASRELHVVDDARRAGGMATRGFDERGVPPISVNLIKEGRASGLYQGPRSAERTGARPSGHERADGTLWPGNLIVRPGSRSRNMLFPELGTFVLVTELTDTHGIDPATGEIDVGARVFVADTDGIRGCAGVHRLRCTADALLGGVQRVCNDQQRHGIVDTATWLVDGIWFS
jgi:PmbA protein